MVAISRVRGPALTPSLRGFTTVLWMRTPTSPVKNIPSRAETRSRETQGHVEEKGQVGSQRQDVPVGEIDELHRPEEKRQTQGGEGQNPSGNNAETDGQG